MTFISYRWPLELNILETLFSLYRSLLLPLRHFMCLRSGHSNELPLIIQYHCHTERKIFVLENKGEKNNQGASSSQGVVSLFAPSSLDHVVFTF